MNDQKKKKKKKRRRSNTNKRTDQRFDKKFSILNGAKYFSSGIFQNYLVLIPAKNTLNALVALLRLIRGNLMECQKKKI